MPSLIKRVKFYFLKNNDKLLKIKIFVKILKKLLFNNLQKLKSDIVKFFQKIQMFFK